MKFLQKSLQKGDTTPKKVLQTWRIVVYLLKTGKGSKINPKTKNPTGDFFHHVTPASKNNVFFYSKPRSVISPSPALPQHPPDSQHRPSVLQAHTGSNQRGRDRLRNFFGGSYPTVKQPIPSTVWARSLVFHILFVWWLGCLTFRTSTMMQRPGAPLSSLMVLRIMFSVVDLVGYVYAPGTQMGAPWFHWLIGLVLGGWPSKIEVIWVPGIYMYGQSLKEFTLN